MMQEKDYFDKKTVLFLLEGITEHNNQQDKKIEQLKSELSIIRNQVGTLISVTENQKFLTRKIIDEL